MIDTAVEAARLGARPAAVSSVGTNGQISSWGRLQSGEPPRPGAR